MARDEVAGTHSADTVPGVIGEQFVVLEERVGRIEGKLERIEESVNQLVRTMNQDNYGICNGDVTHGQPIGNLIPNYNKIEYFGGSRRFKKEDFLDWLLDLEDYFDYKEIRKEKKVRFASYKLGGFAASWWDGLQTYIGRKGKNKIQSWSRMKKILTRKFFIHDYEKILSYTKQDFEEIELIKGEYIEDVIVDPTPIPNVFVLEYNFQQKLHLDWQAPKLESYECVEPVLVVDTSMTEDNLQQELEEEKEKSKVEAIEQKIYDQAHSNKLKQIDFIGVESFLVLSNPLVDVAHKLEMEEWLICVEPKRLKQSIYSKYLFQWEGIIQFSKEQLDDEFHRRGDEPFSFKINSRASFIEEGSNLM